MTNDLKESCVELTPKEGKHFRMFYLSLPSRPQQSQAVQCADVSIAIAAALPETEGSGEGVAVSSIHMPLLSQQRRRSL